MNRLPHSARGIALLDMVALLASGFLLVSIAIPNWVNLSTRAGVARARRDLAQMSRGLELYRLENNAFPPSVDLPARSPIPVDIYDGPGKKPPLVSHRLALVPLTTPVGYLATVANDAPFVARAWEISEAERRPAPHSYWYNNFQDFYLTARGCVAPGPRRGYVVMAFGPRTEGIGGISAAYPEIDPDAVTVPCLNRPNTRSVYDPTNGTYSIGNIHRFGGQVGLEDGIPYIPRGTEE